MPIFLRHSQNLPLPQEYERWLCIGNPDCDLPANKKCKNIPVLLEAAFAERVEDWIAIARQAGAERTANLAHMPTCAANICDFGLMLTWDRIISEMALESVKTLIICDDPWLFRHLKTIHGVVSGPSPSLWIKHLVLSLRGLLARTKVALRVMGAHILLRRHRSRSQPHAPYLLVYGHPRSNAQGEDGYFGPLLGHLPNLKRILHVDAPVSRVRSLASDNRTESLHTWGSLRYSLSLPFRRWRPSQKLRRGPLGWLVRRAACLEGGTGSAAMIAWQLNCQKRWLREARPQTVAWPWENHGWERSFVREARNQSVATIGYQHSVIGILPNYSPFSNPDDVAGLPDQVACNGASSLEQLIVRGVPQERLHNVGALRQVGHRKAVYDPKEPIFVAVPFEANIARQMVMACDHSFSNSLSFLIKDHPMSPIEFEERPNIRRATTTLLEIGGVSAVLFTATTVGLEAWLSGIPTIRFLPEGTIAYNILPDDVRIQTATAETLEEALNTLSKSDPAPFEHFFGPVDFNFWEKQLVGSPHQEGRAQC